MLPVLYPSLSVRVGKAKMRMRARRATKTWVFVMVVTMVLSVLFVVPQVAMAQEEPPGDDYDYRGTDFANIISWTITKEASGDSFVVSLNVKGVTTELGQEYAPEDLAALTNELCMWTEVSEGTWECTLVFDFSSGEPFPIPWNPEAGDWDWEGEPPEGWEDFPPPDWMEEFLSEWEEFPSPDDPGWVDDPSKLPSCEDDPECQWSEENLNPDTYFPPDEEMPSPSDWGLGDGEGLPDNWQDAIPLPGGSPNP